MVSDVGVNAPLDFEDTGVVCDSSGVTVFAGGVGGATDLECVRGSHGNIPICVWWLSQRYLYKTDRDIFGYM